MSVRVNGELIPEAAIRAELQRLIRFFAEHAPGRDLRGEMDALMANAKEQAIGAKLIVDEARRRHIEILESEIDGRVEEMTRKGGGAEAFEALLVRQGLSRESLRESIRSGMQADRLVAEVTTAAAEPTDDDARRYYERHHDEFRTRDQARVRHILSKPVSDAPKEIAASRAKLRRLRKKLAEGADFAATARAWSDCPSGRESGGMLGWMVRGTTLPAFDEAVFALPVGEVSDVIQSPLGLHLLQVMDRETGREASFEDVRDRIFDLIRHSRRGHALTAFVQQLKKAAAIEDDSVEIDAAGLEIPEAREPIGDEAVEDAFGDGPDVDPGAAP